MNDARMDANSVQYVDLSAVADALGGTPVLYPSSVQEWDGCTHILLQWNEKRYVLTTSSSPPLPRIDREIEVGDSTLCLCPCVPENADAMRLRFPWLNPTAIGKRSSIGCGDRIGAATPGHIRACLKSGVIPVLAQQSIREMTRTARTPQNVMDDVLWAVFQEGFRHPWGSDADHLKTFEDVDICFDAGFTMYTIDPSDYVENEADNLVPTNLDERYQKLPWDRLGITPEGCLDRYTAASHTLHGSAGALTLTISPDLLKRAAVKYGSALAHTRAMADHIDARHMAARPGTPYDLEMSVDETDTPTKPEEHLFVAAELHRLGVHVTSLAPRFVGDFQKGIDFIGDPDVFESEFRKHVIIAESFGGYKLSIHSGSDKFTVFPIIGEHAGHCVHLKTAGTSYLEALRIPARYDPDFFRQIINFAFERFGPDTKSYHVTTNLGIVPKPDTVTDGSLETTYLEENNARQLLHITFGSVLTARSGGEHRFRHRLLNLLQLHELDHYSVVARHFEKHLNSIGRWQTNDSNRVHQ